jgi:hypothetical protein
MISSKWTSGPEQLPCCPSLDQNAFQSSTLSVILKREHRLAKSSGRRLVAASFDDATRFRARVHAVVNHLYAVDKDF